MTEEEYFRKNYPDSCYGDKPLSPHWDFFQDGVEFGERQSEKRIEELEKRCATYEMTLSKMEKGICDVCRETKKDKRIAELENENRQLRNEVQDLTAYCNQIGKIKTGVLKLFEHIVAK